MAEILVAVPVLGRPHRAGPLAESLAASTGICRLLFLCSPHDREQIAACELTGEAVEVVAWEPGPGDYARKINRACQLADGEAWVFTGADDLCFCPGWADQAVAFAARRPGFHVIGTNDLGNPRVMSGRHSTHSVVRLDYVRRVGTIDEPGKLYHEGYGHQFCDDELIATARSRGVFAFCREAEVPHLHPHWGKADDDDTYRKGQASFWEDKALYEARRRLWERRGVHRSQAASRRR